MKIEIEGSAREIAVFAMELRSRLFEKTVDSDLEERSKLPIGPCGSIEQLGPPGYRCPPGEKGTPGY